MQIRNIRAVWIALTAACIVGIASDARASLFPTDVLLGQQPIAHSGPSVTFGSPISDLTDGVINPFYVNPGFTVSYDLGSATGRSYNLNGFAISEEVTNTPSARYNWSTVQIEVSDSPSFAPETSFNVSLTPVASNTTVLTNAFALVTGRYVRITDAASTPTFVDLEELGLFGQAVPEPSSLLLLTLGGAVAWRFARRRNL